MAEALSAEIADDNDSAIAGLITPQDRENWEKWACEQAQNSFDNGEACWKAGDTVGALGWLERAHRMTSDSPNVMLLLAVVRQACGNGNGAIALLETLTARHDVARLWCMLAAACLRQGQTETAVGALRRALSRHVCTEDMALLADRIMTATGCPGWCGLDDQGAIRIGGDFSRLLAVDADRRPARRKKRLSPVSDRLTVLVDGEVCSVLQDETGLLHPDTSDDFWNTDRLEVLWDGYPLPGSPLYPSVAMRVEGLVEAADEGVVGWVWHPANPDRAPSLRVLEASTDREIMSFTAEELSPDANSDIPLSRFRQITLSGEDLPAGSIRIVDETGRDLTGSPLEPGRVSPTSRRRKQVSRKKSRSTPVSTKIRSSSAAVLIVIPVYRDVAGTKACLESVLASLPAASRNSPRVLVINDASPEREMALMLRGFAKDPRVAVKDNAVNLGFVATANLGLEAALSGQARARDIVLLNSDTLVAGDWLEELQTVAWSAPEIGTATPLSNDATILSYPNVVETNPTPTLDQTAILMKLARSANKGVAIDIPTGHGFCLYIRHDCLEQTGLLRADLFAQGYGEENDFCLRASQGGWRNVAAPGAYVAHVGSVSFGATRTGLLRRNLALLNRMYPDYHELIAEHVAADPLFEARRKIDLLRWRRAARLYSRKNSSGETCPVVLMVTHDYGGGVERVVRQRAAMLKAAGVRPVLIRPVKRGCRIEGGVDEDDILSASFPNLRFSLPTEWPRLLRLLTADPVDHIEWHHASGHHMAMREIASVLGVPYDVYVHDYIWFCPRISLVGRMRRYCGEPDVATCEACVTTQGRSVDDDMPVADYVLRSAKELEAARSVIVPSDDTAQRMRRHFPALEPIIAPLEDDRPDLSLAQYCRLFPSSSSQGSIMGLPRTPGRFRVCVVGAIGKEKGYDVLLAAAREAREQGRPIEYVIVGHTPDDAALMETGHVYVTGCYREEEATALIRAQQPDYGIIPSIWPETWCFALGVTWRAGLNAAAFDLGAVADRIRTTGRGHILPLGISAEQFNVILISLCQHSVERPS
ncbi:MAG: glycosyltransferase [Acetobacter sp.]|uniref:glycosyltransferase n=1 Tax=Acetobacter sp. TaxID=440 RepID=UPI0039EA1E64